MKLNLDYLLERVWDSLALVRVYTKKRGRKYTIWNTSILVIRANHWFQRLTR